MNKLVRITPNLTSEATGETGLVRMENEKTFEKADIDALQQKAGELGGIEEVQRGLELSIIEAGLQVMAERYGADKLLEAMKNGATFQKIIAELAPEKREREALYEAIENESMGALAERFDETLGGIASGNPVVSHMERSRRYEVVKIKGKITSGGNDIFRYRNKEGRTDSASLLLTGTFNNLLENHPDLVEDFRDTNDTLRLLKGIRDIYETEYAQFATDLEEAKAIIETKVAEGETSVTEQKTIFNDIYTDEIAKLEKRLAEATNDTARETIQGMLDKKAAEVIAAREEFRTKMEAVRNKIVADLGADRLYQLPVAAPAEPQPTYNDKQRDAA